MMKKQLVMKLVTARKRYLFVGPAIVPTKATETNTNISTELSGILQVSPAGLGRRVHTMLGTRDSLDLPLCVDDPSDDMLCELALGGSLIFRQKFSKENLLFLFCAPSEVHKTGKGVNLCLFSFGC